MNEAINRRDFLQTAAVAGLAGGFVTQTFAHADAGASASLELGRARCLLSQSDDPIVGWLKHPKILPNTVSSVLVKRS